MIGNNKMIQKFGDKRIFLESEAIQGMKSLKLNCLEEWKIQQINEMREKEIKHLNVDSWLWSVMTFIASISTLLLSSMIASTLVGVFAVQDIICYCFESR